LVRLRFDRLATVPRTAPDEFWIVTFILSKTASAVSEVVMYHQKLTAAEVALAGMVTV
jgi:hypothetical protein